MEARRYSLATIDYLHDLYQRGLINAWAPRGVPARQPTRHYYTSINLTHYQPDIAHEVDIESMRTPACYWCHQTGFICPARTLTDIVLPELQRIALDRRGVGHVCGLINMGVELLRGPTVSMLPVRLRNHTSVDWCYSTSGVTPHRTANIYVVMYTQERGDPGSLYWEKGGLFVL